MHPKAITIIAMKIISLHPTFIKRKPHKGAVTIIAIGIKAIKIPT